MGITYTYATLTAAILTFAEDSDVEFVAQTDDFIGKAEQRVLRDLDLECFEQWLEVTISGSDRTVSKPTDVIDVTALFVRNPSTLKWFECPRRSFEYVTMYSPTEATTGVPAYYSEYDPDQIYVVPTPDQTYTNGNAKVRALIRPTGLSSSNTTSHLGNHFADILFQACMIEAYEYLKNKDAMGNAATKYQSLVPSLTEELEDVKRVKYKGINKEQQGADD